MLIASLLPTGLLSLARIYRLCAALVGADRVRTVYANEHIRATPGAVVLDLGCGPGDILQYLPPVTYDGYDLSTEYVAAARRQYGDRGTFHQGDIRALASRAWPPAHDLVLATGVVHHLDANDAAALFGLAAAALKPGGRLVTLDGCYRDGQHWIARSLLRHDRGRFVRTREQYEALARRAFDDVKVFIREDLAAVPYTYVILECSNPSRQRSTARAASDARREP